MTSLINRLPRPSPSSSTRLKLLPFLIYLVINVVTILSQTYHAPPDGSTTVEHVTTASETTTAKSASSSLSAYRQTIYTQFANVYATQIPLSTVSNTTRLKCASLCLQMTSCSGFNYLRSPSKSSGSCDPKTDPKGSTCEFLAFKNVSSVQFATGTMPLCRTLYASETSTNQGRSGLNWCLSAPCQNSGTCVAVTDSYFCNCTASTTGRNCETTITVGYDCATNSPCVSGGGQYFPAADTTKYIQCGAGQTCYTMPCPSGLNWDQSIQTCH